MEFLLFFLFLLQIFFVLLAMSFVFPTPISDLGTVRYRTVPWMTFALIIVNSLIFMVWLAPNLYVEELSEAYPYIEKVYTYGIRSSTVREGLGIGAFTAFTSMFMHGDFWHLLGNMIYLWTFGRRVEDACGHWRFLLFYIGAGLIAGLGSIALDPSGSDIPRIGASGAISGVMGAYLLLFPGARVVCLWGIGLILRAPVVLVGKLAGVSSLKDSPLFSRTVQLPALLLLLPWAALQIVPSLEVIQQHQQLEGVDTLAHMMGFLGAVTVFLYVRKDLLTRYLAGRSV